MLRCGLLGEKLSHSRSPEIHRQLGNYAYVLYEKTPEEVPAFIRSGEWDGLNVTIPYKKTVMPYLDELSETAARVGSVNTVIRRKDGTLFGDNTDVWGFGKLLERSGFAVSGKKTLVLGNGGAAVAVRDVLNRAGALTVTISRSGGDNYTNLYRHADASFVVNTTPVGMYPDTGSSPVDLRAFPECGGVLDLIYNPEKTALLKQAEELGIPGLNGWTMLREQAVRSSELFRLAGA